MLDIFVRATRKENGIPYLTVRADEVRMVHENMVEKSGHSMQPKVLHNKESEYYLFQRLLQYLMNSRAIQKCLAVELEKCQTCILLGSRLLRGCWEAWIDKTMHLGSVLELARDCELDVPTQNHPSAPKSDPKTKTSDK
jgi:hypothetical protein